LTLGEDCPFDTVCFHAHQCTEKSLKGLLVAYAIDFPKTHDLVILLRLARSAGLAKVEIDEVQPLNRYAVEARYPGNWEPITRQEAEEAFAMARKVREAVLERFAAGYSEQVADECVVSWSLTAPVSPS
jgi:HEPN domain-containing protein